MVYVFAIISLLPTSVQIHAVCRRKCELWDRGAQRKYKFVGKARGKMATLQMGGKDIEFSAEKFYFVALTIRSQAIYFLSGFSVLK